MMQPVIQRFWQQHELYDGTYVIDDLLELFQALGEAHGRVGA